MSSEAWAAANRRRERRKLSQEGKPTKAEREIPDDGSVEALKIAQERYDKSAVEVATSNQELARVQSQVASAQAVLHSVQYDKEMRKDFLQDADKLEIMAGHLWQFDNREKEDNEHQAK